MDIFEVCNSKTVKFDDLKYCIDITKADINIINVYGDTPFTWICRDDYTDKPKILKWIKKKNIVIYESLENCTPEIRIRFMPSINVNFNDKDIIFY